jgi:uncharacterized membrane protein YdbT with pleckstrin-like domain
MPADEQKIDSFHGSTGRWLYGSAAGLGTSLLIVGGFVLLVVLQNPLALIVSGIGVAILIWKWLQNMTHHYDVTSQRLVIRSGIIMKSIDEVELYRVKDVKVDFSLLGQMAGIGDITLVTSDHTARDRAFVLNEVADAPQRREVLRRLVEENRQRRRVREVDLDSDFG